MLIKEDVVSLCGSDLLDEFNETKKIRSAQGREHSQNKSRQQKTNATAADDEEDDSLYANEETDLSSDAEVSE